MSFLVNRYFALLGNIYALCIDFMPISDEVRPFCHTHTQIAGSQLISAELSKILAIQRAVRVFSTIYRLRKRLLAWITIIFLVLAGGSFAVCFGHHTSDETISLGVGCYDTYTAEAAARFGVAWLALFAFESLIFVLTVHRTSKTRGLLRLRLATAGKRNVLDIMFHDGALYFGAMTLCNIPNILMYYSGSGVIRGSLGLTTFTSCISVTLISRLMLNLHKSIDSGILSTPARGDDCHNLSVFTTRINVQSA
ncbi:hypothetical protein DEU56DRAFT_944941 [Suillus clintonianus]|uniref:uncharacterized protein n=1 Tax=Suillus clintonianus TaxID=1904413 RepID=UPI001B872FC3|nr:uncharacterized protein DEU56DRAFT_944941 [Suillus clintonianus]KAG2138508.1 hypothetical protein DEU56DRAFT_944941 [Suillus clintonianus]